MHQSSAVRMKHFSTLATNPYLQTPRSSRNNPPSKVHPEPPSREASLLSFKVFLEGGRQPTIIGEKKYQELYCPRSESPPPMLTKI